MFNHDAQPKPQQSASPPWGVTKAGYQSCTTMRKQQHLHLSKGSHGQPTPLEVPKKVLSLISQSHPSLIPAKLPIL